MSLDIGNTIRIIRHAKQLKVSDVAKKAKISSPFLTMVEKGDRQPSVLVLQRISDVLEIPLESLLLASQSKTSTLKTTNKQAEGLSKAIRLLSDAEQRLRNNLMMERESSDGTQKSHAKNPR